MRELPPPGKVNLPRDHEPIIWVSPQTYRCQFCDDEDRPGSDTTVDWWAIGRCHECGQKYYLVPYA